MVKLQYEQLKKVIKPARYVAGEYNQVIKSPEDVEVRIALIYTDIYEKGMSDFNYMSKYYAFNSRSDTWCERAFTPWDDYERVLRRSDTKIYGLESKDELKSFDILWFVIKDTLEYTNLLNILDLAKIPVFSEDRKHDFPFVVLHSNNIKNTQNMSSYIDMFIQEYTENTYGKVIDKYISWKKEKSSKSMYIESLINVEGVCVPYTQSITENKNSSNKRYLSDVNYSSKMLVPNIQILNDYIKFDARQDALTSIEYIKKAILNTGITKIGYDILPKSEFKNYEEFKFKILELCEKEAISISLDSINLFDIDKDIFKAIKINKKDRISVNVFSSNMILRKKTKIDADDKKILESIYFLFKNSVYKLKLQFYIGIKEETYLDIENIYNFVNRVIELYYSDEKLRQEDKLNIHVDIKIHEDYYDYGFKINDIDNAKNVQKLETKIKFLQDRFFEKNIKIHIDNPKVAQVKAMLNMKDMAISKIIYFAWKNGAKLDNYEEKFNADAWEKAKFKGIGDIYGKNIGY